MRVLRRIAPACVALLCAAGAARAETMPQLDFGNRLLTAQVVWGALIFAGFYVLASRWALPKVGEVLEVRERTIAGDLDRAHTAKLQAERTVSDLTAARKQAQAQSQAEIAASTQKAKEAAAARAAEQEARLDAQLAESEAQIERARRSAMSALREVASDTAIALVSRLTNGHADQGRVQDAVGHVLAERGLDGVHA